MSTTQGSMDMGIVIQVAGRQMQQDFEPVLERQVHYFSSRTHGPWAPPRQARPAIHHVRGWTEKSS